MIRFGTNIIKQAGPKLERDTWWRVTLAGMIAYLALQSTALLAFVLILIGRSTGDCVVGPECDLFAGWGGGGAGAIATFGTIVSIPIILGLWRMTKALWNRSFWTAIFLRGVGWTTAFWGLIFVLAEGLPWLLVGLWIALASRRMQAGIDWGDAAKMAGQRPPPDEGPVHQIHIEDEPVDRDRVVDVQFEDK